MKTKRKLLISVLLSVMILLCFGIVSSAKPLINKTSLQLEVNETFNLRVTGTKKSVRWDSTNRSIVGVTQKGKIRAKKSGEATITATIGTTTLSCDVTVKQKTSSVKYENSTFKCPKDIPAGQYVLYTNSSYKGYFALRKNSSNTISSIISNDNFEYNDIVTVKSGQYLELTRCYAVPIESVSKIPVSSKGGTYRVGIDIKEGEYELEATSTYKGYYAVSTEDDSAEGIRGIVANDNFDGRTYVTVSNGQYLKLSRCKIK